MKLEIQIFVFGAIKNDQAKNQTVKSVHPVQGNLII